MKLFLKYPCHFIFIFSDGVLIMSVISLCKIMFILALHNVVINVWYTREGYISIKVRNKKRYTDRRLMISNK